MKNLPIVARLVSAFVVFMRARETGSCGSSASGMGAGTTTIPSLAAARGTTIAPGYITNANLTGGL